LTVKFIIINIIAGTDVAVLYLWLMECTCRFGSCYLHQNRFPGHSLYYIDDIVFVSPAVAAVVVVEVAVGTTDYPSIQDSHEVLVCLYPKVSFFQFCG
jgi:hypothetical protein